MINVEISNLESTDRQLTGLKIKRATIAVCLLSMWAVSSADAVENMMPATPRNPMKTQMQSPNSGLGGNNFPGMRTTPMPMNSVDGNGLNKNSLENNAGQINPLQDNPLEMNSSTSPMSGTHESGSEKFNAVPTDSSSLNPLAKTQPESALSNVPVLEIVDAMDEGLDYSPRTAAVRALLPIQKSMFVTAGMLPDPGIMRDEGTYAEQVYRLGPSLTYDPPWKSALNLLVAKRQYSLTKLQILNTLWQFRNDVRRAYTELVVAQETYSALAQLADLSQKLWQVTRLRFEAGAVAELDVMKAELAAYQSIADRDQELGRVEKARQQLNVIIGRDVHQPIAVVHLPKLEITPGNVYKLKIEKNEFLPDLSQPMPPLSIFVERGLAHRLEVKMIKQQIKLNNAQLYSAIGQIVPDPQVQVGSSSNGNPPSGPDMRADFVTLEIEVPVLNYSQDQIPKCKATGRQLYKQLFAQDNQVTQDVCDAYNNLIIARNQLAVYEDHLLADSEQVAELSRLSYESGQSDITAALQALQQNIQVRSQYLSALQDYQNAYTNLEQSTGEPMQ